MTNAILTFNAGSSSLKCALFQVAGSEAPTRLVWCEVEEIANAPHLTTKDANGRVIAEHHWSKPYPDYSTLMEYLLTWAETHLGGNRLVAAGHRVVHGGIHYQRPELVTPGLLGALGDLIPLAPLHQPHNIAPISAIAKARPTLPQVACFDTAFHHYMPPVATRFAIPRKYEAQGIRRYGFHGLSYEYISNRLREIAPRLARGRVIVAHLGNGASACAMKNGRSIDTTMGFSALDGLVMGTRPGTLDPGVILFLEQGQCMKPDALQRLLYDESGLLGVSGISSDMRTLLASDEVTAKEAIELFVFRLLREIGGLIASLGGLDGFVFTAGIGEHATSIRAMVCTALGFMGAKLDQEANQRNATLINTPDSQIALYVIPTNEEEMIARHTAQIIRPA